MLSRSLIYEICATALMCVALEGPALAGGPFNYRIPIGAVPGEAPASTPTPVAPPATSYPFYQWPTWFPKTADGYVIDWYTYDNNRDGALDGTRVGLSVPGQAYSLYLSGGERTILAVEALTPGLSFDTGVRDGGNCFEAAKSPAPTVNGNGTACYLYPQYAVRSAGENKVAFKIKHTLGEDIVGMVFYGYDGPDITTTLASTVSLGTVPFGATASLTFHAANRGKGSGTLKDSKYGSWTAASCPGVTVVSNGVTFAPGAECDVTVGWPGFYKTTTIKTVDMLGAQVSSPATINWTN